MSYVACTLLSGQARVDTDEIAELAWCSHQELNEYVPYGFYEPVQDYLAQEMRQ